MLHEMSERARPIVFSPRSIPSRRASLGTNALRAEISTTLIVCPGRGSAFAPLAALSDFNPVACGIANEEAFESLGEAFLFDRNTLGHCRGLCLSEIGN